MEKSKTTSFSQTFEVAENKEPLFFSFLASRHDVKMNSRMNKHQANRFAPAEHPG